MPGDNPILNFTGNLLWAVTAVVSVALFCLIVWILVRLQTHKHKELQRHHIREQWNTILASILMDELVLEQRLELPETFLAELKKPFVRGVLSAELVRTRQSLRGQMADTVIAVYNQMGLEAHAGKLLQSAKWHQQAKAIQQLSYMAQHQYHDAIFQRINHPNTWVRNEAQLGMLRLRGAQGLDFLKQLRHPLSEWQQFNLLHQLQLQHSKEPPEIGEWLFSQNSSVVVFSIRLCRMYQLFQYIDQIQKLQQHAEASIRAGALECLHHWDVAALLPADTSDVTVFQMAPEAQIAY